VDFAASFSSSGKKSLDTRDKVCSRQLKNLCEFQDGRQRRAVSPALEQADVLGMISAVERECFLSEMALQAQFAKNPCESPLFRRCLFRAVCHPQVESAVCQSIVPQSIVSRCIDSAGSSQCWHLQKGFSFPVQILPVAHQNLRGRFKLGKTESAGGQNL